jgi:hypothetical protein
MPMTKEEADAKAKESGAVAELLPNGKCRVTDVPKGPGWPTAAGEGWSWEEAFQRFWRRRAILSTNLTGGKGSKPDD